MNAIPRPMTMAAASLCLAATSLSTQAADGDGWEWMVAPYGWAASIGVDLRTGEPPAGGTVVDLDFDNIIDKIDGAFQVHVEGRGDHFGMFADFTYLGLADDRSHPRFRTESDLDTRLFELAAVWSPGMERGSGIELFAGLRYIDVDLAVRLDPENPNFDTTSLDVGRSYSDLMLGIRYAWPLSDRWGLMLRGDSSFGDTDGTWNASAVLDYRMKHGAWLFGYRYLSAELESNDNRLDITMSGPMVGYGVTF